MVNGMELSTLAIAAQDRKAKSLDVVAENARVRMGDSGQRLLVGGHEVAPTPTMHGQIATALGVPLRYYRTMQEEAPALLAENANHWLEAKADDRHTHRLMQGENGLTIGRAFLGDRYRVIDGLDMLHAAIVPLQDRQVTFRSQSLTDENFYMQVTARDLVGEVRPGDVHFGGLIVSTNEVGGGTAMVRQLIYRQVCTNGMVVSVGKGKQWRRRHVGARHDFNGGAMVVDYQRDTLAASNEAMRLQIRDAITAALDPAAFQAQLAMLREATDDRIESARPTQTVETLSASVGLSTAESEEVLKNLIGAGDYTRFGVAQSVTSLANTLDSYDRAVELEGFGHMIASGSLPEWGAIRKAGAAA